MEPSPMPFNQLAYLDYPPICHDYLQIQPMPPPIPPPPTLSPSMYLRDYPPPHFLSQCPEDQCNAEYVSVIQAHPNYAHGHHAYPSIHMPPPPPPRPFDQLSSDVSMAIQSPYSTYYAPFPRQDIIMGMEYDNPFVTPFPLNRQFENGPGLDQGNIYKDTFLCPPQTIKAEDETRAAAEDNLDITINHVSTKLNQPHPSDPYPQSSELFGSGNIFDSQNTQILQEIIDPLPLPRPTKKRKTRNAKPKNKETRVKVKRIGKTKVTDLVFKKKQNKEFGNGVVVMTSQPPLDFIGHRPLSPVTIQFSTNPGDTDPRELEKFSEEFKRRRIKLEMTQTDVGRALTHLHIPGVGKLSQSTICRFESLTLSHNNMIALKPILEAWLDKAERAFHSWDEYNYESGILPRRQKRRRTAIANREKMMLEECFKIQRRPSGKALCDIASRLDLAKNVVRVWFCNRRQKDRKHAAEDQWLNLTFDQQNNNNL